MKYAIYDITSGDILHSYTGTNPELNISPQQNFMLIEDEADVSNHYIENDIIVSKPAKPDGRFWIFDFQSKLWVLDESKLSLGKSRKKAQVSAKVEELKYVPIIYDGKNLDADLIAQTNISGKIAQLQNEIALSIPSIDLFWKDADNIIHTWTDPAVYLEWLRGLQIAIANRTTNLYNTAWTGKDAIDAFTTLADVTNYDINALFGI